VFAGVYALYRDLSVYLSKVSGPPEAFSVQISRFFSVLRARLDAEDLVLSRLFALTCRFFSFFFHRTKGGLSAAFLAFRSLPSPPLLSTHSSLSPFSRYARLYIYVLYRRLRNLYKQRDFCFFLGKSKLLMWQLTYLNGSLRHFQLRRSRDNRYPDTSSQSSSCYDCCSYFLFQVAPIDYPSFDTCTFNGIDKKYCTTNFTEKLLHHFSVYIIHIYIILLYHSYLYSLFISFIFFLSKREITLQYYL